MPQIWTIWAKLDIYDAIDKIPEICAIDKFVQMCHIDITS